MTETRNIETTGADPGRRDAGPETIDGFLKSPDVGPYRVGEILGLGASSTVYRAHGPDGVVAIKVLSTPIAPSVTRKRFEREARLLTNLSHPNVVGVLGSGVVATTRGPRAYIVLDYVEGASLRAWLNEAPSSDRRLDVLLGMVSGVAYAHTRGIVHRDLKPENVLVRRADDTPCIIDFGVARPAERRSRSPHLTRQGDLIGTLAYMSPEQVEGRLVGPATDVYSLGVICHEVLSGRPPYGLTSPTPNELIVAITRDPAPGPGSGGIRGRLLRAVLARATAKAPAARHPNAGAFLADLRCCTGATVVPRLRLGLQVVAGRLARLRVT